MPPTRDGRLHATDVARLAGFHERLTALFAEDLGAGRQVGWRVTSERTAVAAVDLADTVRVGLARLEEDITQGQAVARDTLLGADEGNWRVLARGTTIGYARLDRFPPTRVRRVRVVVEDAVSAPAPLRITVYANAAP